MAARYVCSKDSTKCQIPSLLDATSDELFSGLKQELFNSVDLVNVSSIFFPPLLILYYSKNNMILYPFHS